METLNAKLALIPLLPLIGAVLSYVVGKQSKHLAGWVATLASFGAFLVVVKLFLGLPEGAQYEQTVFTWFAVEYLRVDFTFRFDHLSAVMGLVVTGIGTLIHLYSVGYMHEDQSEPRFFSYLNLFMFSMLLLVLGGNLMVLFVGWEGVGLCSYLLIGFWFKNLAYASAGRKAFVVNRIGDAGFLLGIFLLYANFGSLDFVTLADAVGAAASKPESVGLFALITACLFVGATGKSAQIPLFVWLPDAMAGPTPVSALIHAATMVTAGIYMLARMHFLFILAPSTMAVICAIAMATAIVSATTAVAQNDIKKVLAYSTVSQLGFMFLAASVGAFWVAIFHVVTHAFFKACLFLGAGSVIHGCHHEQDMRHMGGLGKLMPITAITYGISTLAIAGIYPFAGFQSKHAILHALAHTDNPYLIPWAHVLVVAATATAFLTAFYMTRSFALTFMGKYRGHAHPHESPWTMTAPLVVLAALATVGGVYLAHGQRLEEYLSLVKGLELSHEEGSLVQNILGSWVGFAGLGLGLLFYTSLSSIPKAIYNFFPPLSRLLERKYYVDELYGATIVRPLESMAKGLWKVADQGIIDGTVNGTGAIVDISGEIVRTTQTGQLRTYGLFLFLATVFIVVFYLVM